MNLNLDAKDIGLLSAATQAAMIDAFVLVIAADRELSQHEVAVFNGELKSVPWSLGASVLDMLIERARNRLKCTPRELGTGLWIKEIAMTVQEPAIREKVLGTMGRIALAAGETQDAEREVINAFAAAFSIPPDRLAAIRAQILADARAGKA